VCHRYGIMVMIDGAHVLGQIPLDIPSIDADFYLSNGHKWFYTPKGSAILWVRKDRQSLIYPTTISGEGRGNSTYQMQFSYEGTLDYTAYLTFPTALAFRRAFGDAKIMTYMHNLAISGGQILATRWGTDFLVPPELFGAMVNVRLNTTGSHVDPSSLATVIFRKYNTWVPFYPLQNNWYTRVSAQIYNEESDYHFLAEAVLATLFPNTTQAAEFDARHAFKHGRPVIGRDS